MKIGVYPGVLQLLAMMSAMGMGFALSVGPATPVFVKHTGLQLFMLGTVTAHLTVSAAACYILVCFVLYKLYRLVSNCARVFGDERLGIGVESKTG